MSTPRIKQVELYDIATSAKMVCWVEDDSRIKKNSRLTLKAIPDRTWQVVEVYHSQERDSLNRRWNVGGL